jgi:hypothetical protein
MQQRQWLREFFVAGPIVVLPDIDKPISISVTKIVVNLITYQASYDSFAKDRLARWYHLRWIER